MILDSAGPVNGGCSGLEMRSCELRIVPGMALSPQFTASSELPVSTPSTIDTVHFLHGEGEDAFSLPVVRRRAEPMDGQVSRLRRVGLA